MSSKRSLTTEVPDIKIAEGEEGQGQAKKAKLEVQLALAPPEQDNMEDKDADPASPLGDEVVDTTDDSTDGEYDNELGLDDDDVDGEEDDEDREENVRVITVIDGLSDANNPRYVTFTYRTEGASGDQSGDEDDDDDG